MEVNLETVVVGPFAVNCYLYWDKSTGDGVVIDPGDEPERIIKSIDELEFTPRAILLTHGHGDHIAAVREVKEHYDIPLLIGRGEEELLKNPSANVSAMLDSPIVAPDPDQLLDDEQIISFGTISFRVLATPGHSPAGVCFLDEKAGNLICGDTLFAGSIGRTDFPGCSIERLLDSIQKKILALPDSVVCFPGHGPTTTVGAERNGNPFLIGGQFA